MKLKVFKAFAIMLLLCDLSSITLARYVGRSKKFGLSKDFKLRIHHNEIDNSEQNFAFETKGRLSHIAILPRRCGKSHSLFNNNCIRVQDKF